jgi:hypothetical protein
MADQPPVEKFWKAEYTVQLQFLSVLSFISPFTLTAGARKLQLQAVVSCTVSHQATVIFFVYSDVENWTYEQNVNK